MVAMKITKVWPINPISRDKRKKDNDDEYCAWLRKQKSAYSHRVAHRGRTIVAAHYRTAKNSGVGIKPLFSAIPLTNEEHLEQHRVGQFKFASRAWWEAQVSMYQQLYIAEGGKIPEKYLTV